MCIEGTYTGMIVKVVEGAKSGTYEITIKWEGCNNLDDIFDFLDPEEGVALYDSKDGIAVANSSESHFLESYIQN